MTGARTRAARIRVRYADTDRMGVAYYANYLVWFEVGRTEWFRATGLSYREIEAEGTSLPVVEAHCEYRTPARYDDELDIRTRATLVTAVRVRFDYEVCRQDVVTAVGHTVHAAVDARGRPRRLSVRVQALLQ
jgi:acyl-CoA thioester hydrolase